MLNQIIQGDVLKVLEMLPSESIDCCITSPPYWNLRDYGIDGQLGLERTPEEYVAKMVEVFREVRRVLKKEGTCWLNLGDSYATKHEQVGTGEGDMGHNSLPSVIHQRRTGRVNGLEAKNLVGIPWRVAFALQSDGWYLRQDIIWHKPNPMPESVTDRCTKAHEYIFLLTKSPRYYFNNEAIREQPKMKEMKELGGVSNYNNGKREHKNLKYAEIKGANKRSVWTITTTSFREAHFATFPENLIKPMVLAGCPKEVCNKCGKARKRITEQPEWEKHQSKGMAAQDYEGNPMYKGGSHNDGLPYRSKTKEMVEFTDCGCNAGWSAGIVLDPFMGAGTTALTAKNLKRNYVGIELNPSYIKMAEKRLRQEILL